MSSLKHLLAVTAAFAFASTASAQSLSKSDTQFLEQAAQNGHAEVQSGKLAQSKSSDPQVKSFAEHMVADHTKTNRELASLAKTKGYKPPTEPSIKQKAQLKLLGTLNGERFDESYAEQMGVEAHQDTIALFERGAKEAQDPQVKAFATKTLPTLQEHLKMAQELHGDVSK